MSARRVRVDVPAVKEESEFDVVDQQTEVLDLGDGSDAAEAAEAADALVLDVPDAPDEERVVPLDDDEYR